MNPRLVAAALLFLAAAGIAIPERSAAAGQPSIRAYPPSCLDYPLPQPGAGTISSGFWDVPGEPERILYVVFRVPCAGGNSALLIGLDNGRSGDSPMPRLVATQVGLAAPVTLRAARSGNSRTEELKTFTGGSGDTFVLELPIDGAALDIDRAFRLSFVFPTRTFDIDIPAYVPPANPQDLFITGYLSGSWYDPAHPGEGIFLEIGDNRDGTVFAFFSWFTYDGNGNPFWLIGQGAVTPGGAQRVVVPTRIYRGGRFAGAFAPGDVQASDWGTVTFSFPDCNTMALEFAGAADAPKPSGNGTRRWSRLVDIHKLNCQ